MNKTLKTGLTVLAVSLICIVAFAIVLSFLGKNIEPKTEVFEDISEYEELFGKDGSYKNNFVGKGDIFPEKLADSAVVEKFRVEYKQPYDEKYNYMAYLVYTCDNDSFETECERLSSLSSTNEDAYKGIYGITEFKQKPVAVYADEEYGITYALCDENNGRLIYFALSFNKYYTDIDYSKTVDGKYLPDGFNAYMGNAIFEEKRKEK